MVEGDVADDEEGVVDDEEEDLADPIEITHFAEVGPCRSDCAILLYRAILP